MAQVTTAETIKRPKPMRSSPTIPIPLDGARGGTVGGIWLPSSSGPSDGTSRCMACADIVNRGLPPLVSGAAGERGVGARPRGVAGAGGAASGTMPRGSAAACGNIIVTFSSESRISGGGSLGSLGSYAPAAWPAKSWVARSCRAAVPWGGVTGIATPRGAARSVA